MSVYKSQKVMVKSAAILSKNQISSLENLLAEKLGKSVEVLLDIDETLISGLYVSFDEAYVDLSVRKKIIDMKESIKKGIL